MSALLTPMIGAEPAAVAETAVAREWRVVSDWPDYEVSDHGEVRRVTPARNARAGRVCRTWKSFGYLRACLSRDGIQKMVFVHRLVAEAFLPPPKDGQTQVAHGNGVRHDNRLSNLRWATPTENQADRILHGTNLCGESHPQAKLSEEDVRAIRSAAAASSYNVICRKFGVSKTTVADIIKRKEWRHVS